MLVLQMSPANSVSCAPSFFAMLSAAFSSHQVLLAADDAQLLPMTRGERLRHIGARAHEVEVQLARRLRDAP